MMCVSRQKVAGNYNTLSPIITAMIAGLWMPAGQPHVKNRMNGIKLMLQKGWILLAKVNYHPSHIL
jgi:hypothetical protein